VNEQELRLALLHLSSSNVLLTERQLPHLSQILNAPTKVSEQLRESTSLFQTQRAAVRSLYSNDLLGVASVGVVAGLSEEMKAILSRKLIARRWFGRHGGPAERKTDDEGREILDVVFSSSKGLGCCDEL
jgi:hypothetical protein